MIEINITTHRMSAVRGTEPPVTTISSPITTWKFTCDTCLWRDVYVWRTKQDARKSAYNPLYHDAVDIKLNYGDPSPFYQTIVAVNKMRKAFSKLAAIP